MRPIKNDPGRLMVQSMIDASEDDWYLIAGGDIDTGAMETMRSDGTDHQRVIGMSMPVRKNHSQVLETFRLLMDPHDAIVFAKQLVDSALWLMIDGADDEAE